MAWKSSNNYHLMDCLDSTSKVLTQAMPGQFASNTSNNANHWVASEGTRERRKEGNNIYIYLAW